MKFKKIGLITLITILFFIISINTVNALSGYSDAYQISILNSTGAGVGYQIPINVYYGSGTSNSTHIYLESKTQTDFDDIRFTKDDDTTLLDSYLIKKSDGVYANLMVKIDDDLSTSNVSIIMWYGNNTVSDYWNGTNTFPAYFEDFTSGWISGNEITTSADWTRVSTGDGYCRVYNNVTEYKDGWGVKAYSPSGGGTHSDTNPNIPTINNTIQLSYLLRWDNYNGGGGSMAFCLATGSDNKQIDLAGNGEFSLGNTLVSTYNGDLFSDSVLATYSDINQGGGTCDLKINNVIEINDGSQAFITPDRLLFKGGDENIYVDDIFFHKYTDNEPSIYEVTTYVSGEKINSITLNNPTNDKSESYELPKTIEFKYTPIIYHGTLNYSRLYTNITGSWSNTQQNNTVVNNTLNKIDYTFTTAKKIIWNVGVYNGSEITFSSVNYTYEINEIVKVVETISVTVEINTDYQKPFESIRVIPEIDIEPPTPLTQSISVIALMEIADTDFENNKIVSGVEIDKNNITVYSSFWGLSGLVNVTIDTEIENWLFENEVYNLEVWFNKTDYGRININDTIHQIRFIYNNQTNTAYIEIKDATGTYENDYIAQSLGTEIEKYDNLTKVNWRFILGQEIVDCVNRELSYYTEDINNNKKTGKVLGKQFNIYNLGGYVQYTFDNNAGRIDGGDAYELYAQYDGDLSLAISETYYRKLQQVHIEASLDTNNNTVYDHEENTGMIIYGLDHVLENGGSETMLQLRLQIDKGAVDVSGTNRAWIRWKVMWYGYNKSGDFVNIKTDYISGYPDCGYEVDNEKTTTQYYVDFWINKVNSSTVIGGRFNPVYYGIEEEGIFFGIFSGNTTALIFNKTDSTCFNEIRNSDGDIVYPTNQELTLFYTSIQAQLPSDKNKWSLIEYDELNFKTTDGRMKGIDTPPKTPTIMPTQNKGGMFAPLIKAVESIGQFMWNGVLGAMRIIIGAIDSFMLYLGFSLTLSQMINFVNTRASSLITYIEYVLMYSNDITYIFVQLVVFIVSIIQYVIDGIIFVIVWVLPIPIHIITFFIAIIQGGTWTYAGYVWDFSQTGAMFDSVRIILPYIIVWNYMFWLFFGNSEKDDITGLPKRVVITFRFIRDAYTDIFWIFSRMYNTVISIYNFIRSHIPFLSGGGGETEE